MASVADFGRWWAASDKVGGMADDAVGGGLGEVNSPNGVFEVEELEVEEIEVVEAFP
jgi:hypothetical protein